MLSSPNESLWCATPAFRAEAAPLPRLHVLLLAPLLLAPALPVALGEDSSFREDWEGGTLFWVPSGVGARQDCEMGRPGCSVELTLVCCDFFVRNGIANVVVPLHPELSRAVDVPLPAEGMRFSFSFHALRGFADGATRVALQLDTGEQLEVVPYSRWTGGLSFTGADWRDTDRNLAAWEQGRWHDVVVHIDPTADLAWIEARDDAGGLLGVSSAVRIAPGASAIRSIALRTSTFAVDLPFGTSSLLDGTDVIHYDTLVASPEPAPLPARVEAVTAAAQPGGPVTLSWAAAEGAAAYRVWRSVSGLPWTQLAEVPADARTYVDADVAQSTSYRYRVSARSESGAEGAASASASTTLPCRPYAPWYFDVASTATAAELEWDGGHDCGWPLSEILVARDGQVVDSLVPWSWAWSDVNATPGVRHEYSIAYRNVAGLSDAVVAHGGIGGPGEPRDLLTAGRRNAVDLTWQPPADTPAAIGYDIAWYGNEWGGREHVTGTSWTHEDAGNGATYQYAVRAHNEVGHGRWSEPVFGVPTPENAPRNVSAVAAGPAVALHWDGPAPPDTLCNSYRVYRSTDLVVWTRLAPNGVDPQCGGLDDSLPGAYVDATPVLGAVNHYRVVATYSSQSFFVRTYEGPPSEVVSVPVPGL